MATAPVKSQPLHNFSLPNFLRWGGGSNGHHPRFRRSAMAGESASAETDSDRNESDPDSRPIRAGSRHSHRFLFGAGSSGNLDKPRGQSPDLKEENQRISGRNGKISSKNDGNESEGAEEAEAEAEAQEEAVQRPWNLRPRRANPSPRVGEFSEAAAAIAQSPGENQQPKSTRLRGLAETSAVAGGERKEKRRFWIALSKEEIEEDIFVMTGSRPARRPKKRAKHVQKQLNSIFPGLWLVGASADDCRQTDAQAKVFPFLSRPL
ncbi:hypothetical protein CDL15_Pgr003767 [Punica granatum]|uniref:Uncharacterized protein n=1 Tax=Punica granatum TaxID=22663 RepID=A0A218XT58_PUNGR|nr:hypothetical protein CDL15_Pgr003767 [Punica granatum]